MGVCRHTVSVFFVAMRRRELDQAIRRLAECQHGVVARAQARQLGLGRACLAQEWELLTPLVLRLAGSQRTHRQRCMAAALDGGPGAVVSGVTAAWLWQLPGFAPGEVHISRERGGNGRVPAAARLHEPRSLPAHHRTVVDAIPVTTVARTLFDLAGLVHPLRVERALDNALARRLVALETMRGLAIELFEHGRTGSALVRQLLSDRGAGYIPPASGLEARFLSVLVRAGIQVPDKQVDLGGETWAGRVDFVDRRLRVVFEIDSDVHHTSKLDCEADARRDATLRAAGFEVVRITERDLRERPEAVVAMVRAARGRAARSISLLAAPTRR